jgi:hypothetical protein
MERIAIGLSLPDHARVLLGLAPLDWTPPLPNVTAVTHTPPDAARSTRSVEAGTDGKDGDPVRRRSFVGLAGRALAGGLFPPTGPERAAPGDFPGALLRYRWIADDGHRGDAPELRTLRAAVDAAKRTYQASRYADAGQSLPDLLAALDDAAALTEGDTKLTVAELTAEAYHVAASLQLKAGNEGSAWIAAERSMRAAECSESPVMIASSARIITHALMDGRHYGEAKTLASKVAAKLPGAWHAPTGDALSVYGSLLLRGAIAAARNTDRAGALELVDEAGEVGRRLGGDHNHMWTAFGPTNVVLHRVNIALALGDAGAAIEHARSVDLAKVELAERRACLFVDVAHAYAQWGKYDQAYRALLTAEDHAPEELSGRPAVRALVLETATNAPRSIRRDTWELAQRVGAA